MKSKLVPVHANGACMFHVTPSNRCAKHNRVLVTAAYGSGIKVCPSCKGGKLYIKTYGVLSDAGKGK